MKILQLIQKAQLRGAEMFACQLSNHILDEGHDVVMIALFKGDAALPFKGKIFHLDLPIEKRLVDFGGWRLLATKIKEFKPDIVQANAGDTLKYAVFSKMVHSWKAPIVFRNANKVSDFITSWPRLMFNRFLVRRVSHVISVSELCRQDFIKTYGYPVAKTTMVPIGIDIKLKDVKVPEDLAAILATGNILVHVAGFVPEKNHKGLLRIVRNLLDKGESVRVVLIGEGRLRSEIHQRVKDLQLEKHVFLVGPRNDVLSVLSMASALVLPSSIEGLPGVILEAMYCHTPVVAYNVGGISEVVRPSETGWLVQAGDEAAFSEAVQEVLHGNGNELIVENAYSLVVREFDNRTIARRFLNIYEKIEP